MNTTTNNIQADEKTGTMKTAETNKPMQNMMTVKGEPTAANSYGKTSEQRMPEALEDARRHEPVRGRMAMRANHGRDARSRACSPQIRWKTNMRRSRWSQRANRSRYDGIQREAGVAPSHISAMEHAIADGRFGGEGTSYKNASDNVQPSPIAQFSPGWAEDAAMDAEIGDQSRSTGMTEHATCWLRPAWARAGARHDGPASPFEHPEPAVEQYQGDPAHNEPTMTREALAFAA